MRVKHNNAREAFVWGKHTVAKIYKAKGSDAAEAFVVRLRDIWSKGNVYKDKSL